MSSKCQVAAEVVGTIFCELLIWMAKPILNKVQLSNAPLLIVTQV